MTRVRAVAIVVTMALAAATAPGAVAGAKTDPRDRRAFEVQGSVHQVAVLHAPAHAGVELARKGKTLEAARIDELGSHLFRTVEAGDGYSVVVTTKAGRVRSPEVRVTSARDVPPPQAYENARLRTDNLTSKSGFGYLMTRDGTLLSVQVVLPGPPDKGPYPAVVEYSGYDPSSPTTSQPQYKLLMPALGFAWVGVNIRGTGCSGGAFNFFENLQALDGYDAIETVAAQPWSTGRVGMVGISYAGISQLFTARTRPPHLAAITPLSVIDDTWRGTLYPGGIFNDGFALGWAKERMDQNRWPNSHAPQWVMQRIAEGDTVCRVNMALRGQNVDLIRQIKDHPYFSNLDPEFRFDFPDGGSSLAPAEFVHRITAPVFIAGAWQDEQTGGHWANMLDRFSPGTKVRVVGQNGVHTESLDPNVLPELIEFLDFYVARKIPTVPPIVRFTAPAIWAAITGVRGLQIPPDRFGGFASFDAALAAFEAEPPVRILWETGNAPGAVPGAPLPAAESRYSAWPVPEARATTWYFRSHGQLSQHRSASKDATDTFRPDPDARPRTSFTGDSDGIWKADPPYGWTPVGRRSSLSYTTEPLDKALAMVGTGSVDLWISSTARDGDVQVTLSEVRPDGSERYVQNGWLRLSHRKVVKAHSSALSPFHSDLERDSEPMPKGTFVRARVAIFPFAYEFRAGSRLRLTIEAPGGDRPLWTFDTPRTHGSVTDRVARSAGRPSRIVLPVLPSLPALPEAPAPCPSLRAQPCRAAPRAASGAGG